jgi:hypothetical protein
MTHSQRKVRTRTPLVTGENGPLMEVIRRLRNGGQQFVRVEHVHVSDGGRAVIGNVQQQDTEERRTT